jgi:hypothetical protein
LLRELRVFVVKKEPSHTLRMTVSKLRTSGPPR